MNDLIQVKLLGEFAVSNAQGYAVKFHSKLERQLLAYLAFFPQIHDRDALADVFWSLERHGAGRKNLSQLMWRVSQSIGQDVFAADRDTVQLKASSVLVDLNLLREQLNLMVEVYDPTMAQKLMAASQQELLKGLSEDWVFEARDTWQVELTAGLRKLEHLAEKAGVLEDVIGLARAQINLEPLNERANAAVIRTTLILGRSSEARDHFEFFKRALADIGETVSGKMRVLAERIQSGQSRSNISSPSAELGLGLPMVGRSRVREICLTAMAQAKQGFGQIVLIEGEPGIGKSRLIQSLIDDATWRGQNVLRATAQEFGQAEPYRLIQDLLSDNLGRFRLEVLKNQLDPVWLLEAARVVPKLAGGTSLPASAGALQDHGRLQTALLEILKTLARLQPLAIFIDDLQWADQSSLELLQHLARILEALPIIVVIGTRTLEARAQDGVWHLIESLDRHGYAQRLQLEPLKKDKIKEMAQKALGINLLPEVVTHLEQVSQGNPLLVIETLKVMLETGIALKAQEHWLVGLQTMPLPTGLREVIESRVMRLTPKSRELLHVAATIGTRFEFELLQQIMPIPTLELLDLLDSLMQNGFLVEIEPGFGFSHDQLRQTVYQQLAKSLKLELHVRILHALEVYSPDATEVLAMHAERSEQFQKAKHYHLLAAEKSIELHSYAQALSDLEAIGELSDSDFDSTTQIRFLEARILADTANHGFERMLRDMNALEAQLEHQPNKRLKVLCRRAITLAGIGRSPEALALIEQAQHSMLKPDAFDQAQILIAHGGVYLAGSGPFDLAVAPLLKAVQLCVEHQLNLEPEARANLGLAYSQLAQFPDALHEYQMALHLAEQDGDRSREALTLGRIAACYCSQGYGREAIPFLERAISLCRKLGLRVEEAKNLSNFGYAQFQIGNVNQGIELYDQALALSKALGATFSEAHILGATAFYKYLHNEPKLADQQLQLALEKYTELGDLNGQGFVLSQLGLLHHWLGELEHANNFLQRAIEVLVGIKELVGEMSAVIWLIENLILQLRYAEARDLAIQGQERAKLHLLPNEELQFARLVATVSFCCGDAREALELLQECLPEDGIYQGVEIDGFYRFHLLNFKVLNALNKPTSALASLQKAYQFAQIELQSYPVSQRPGWRKAIPVVNEILSLFEQHFELKISVRLAAKNAPSGRSLQTNEYVNVDWLVHTSADEQILDKTKRRQHQLKRLCSQALEQGGLPTVDDLAQALGTSVATIKRDLAALREQGISLSTRGTRALLRAK